MKTLELKEMEVIEGGLFWGGFCAAAGIIGGAGGLAAWAGLIVVSGPAVVVIAIVGIGCGIAAFN